MSVNISAPLDDITLSSSEKSFLRGLQANILKGHGREHVALIFLTINDEPKARKFLHSFPVTDALKQLQEVKEFKASRAPGGVVRLAFLSKAGLDVFKQGSKFTSFGLFSGGMAADVDVLDGGSTATWQHELTQPIHVALLLAYHDAIDFARIVGKLVGDLQQAASGFDVTFVQQGQAYKNSDGQGVEHFGYVDGRSQPLMLKSEIQAEPRTVYDPSSPLSQFILPDPLDSTSFGSFVVFRKLEQNVAGFKHAEDALAVTMGLTGPDAERAGAQVVGRFEDGTPVTLHKSEKGMPVVNDFDYTGDAGGKCPFQGHIRKTNPRGSSPGGPAFDKTVQMARRGITYGCRLQDPDSKEFIDEPNDGVGLLFMSYQSSIESQFHFMQKQWANNPNFPQAGTGIDPGIGQGSSTLPQIWPPVYGSPTGGVPSLFKGFVTLKGGEYLYAPSVSGLKAL